MPLTNTMNRDSKDNLHDKVGSQRNVYLRESEIVMHSPFKFFAVLFDIKPDLIFLLLAFPTELHPEHQVDQPLNHHR